MEVKFLNYTLRRTSSSVFNCLWLCVAVAVDCGGLGPDPPAGAAAGVIAAGAEEGTIEEDDLLGC